MVSKTLKRIAASDGTVVAPAYLLVEPDLLLSKTSVSDVDAKVARFREAVKRSTKELEKVRNKAKESLGTGEAQVFDAYLLFLSGPEFTGAIEAEVKNQKVNAEAALDEAIQRFITIFEDITDNTYMRKRTTDVHDVSKRIMAHPFDKRLPDSATIDHEIIAMAYDLTPSDTAQLNKKYIKGFIADIGGRTAHLAITTRSLEVPAVVGTGSVTKDVKDGGMLIADDLDGDAIVNPTDAQVEEYTKKGETFAKQKEEQKKLKNEPSITADNREFVIATNIGIPKDMKGVEENDAKAVGLYRIEFLYMNSRDFPPGEAQFDAYREVIEDMDDKQTITRTCDIGGDKHLGYWDLPEEMNPFLDVRAIRLSIQYKDIFRIQLRALLHASIYGPLGIVFPVTGTLAELRETKRILVEEKDKLVEEDVKVGNDLQVGMVIEVPATTVLADQFAKKVNFLSIGTNDLIQYTMATDHGNDNVSYLYRPHNPSVLRLIRHTIDDAHKNSIWCGMCGEAAGDDIIFLILLSIGPDEYSTGATSILHIRSLMKRINAEDIRELASKACFVSETADKSKKLVEETMKRLNINDQQKKST